MASSRSRSPSPVHEEPRPKKQKTGGFKWKEKKPRDFPDQAEEQRDSGKLERGYRNRSPRRESHRDRENDREQTRDGALRRPDIADKFGASSERRANSTTTTTTTSPNTTTSTTDAAPSKPKKDKKDKKPKSTLPSEPMIIVNVNDRLGTKAAIPCLASDSIKAFKAVVAAHIGRQPHEIMLKRQGERPFKDQLTLADYGVSNGVQLDLELDTGD